MYRFQCRKQPELLVLYAITELSIKNISSEMIDYPSEIGLDLDSLVENGYFCFHILCERS